ncbi:hypothetical protein H4J46_16770 [Colwellia sp. MB02u-6]|uniref:hypothetical protein n=1 Tax=Colwellia sp. MB02u-6 TaxID=2759824 RepID=UPI0015F71980|nr:hypothetical protein [Colwellia sp. MB02u-6]MBA6329565.1 hypothetical protein [Colwellia sp. MB02u-6]
MSTSIPFDPSLALGNIVPQSHLDNLEQISAVQAPVDGALLELNSSLLLKHKLMMTLNELGNLGIDSSPIDKSMKEVDKTITTSATNYASKAAESLPKVAELRGKIQQVGDSIESPINYNKSNIKKIPISADSMTMDAQYFSFDQTEQSDQSVMATMKSFVSASTSFLGNSRSAQMTASMQQQVSHQREVHDIQGVLVITANCTHKNANLFAPFVIDVDKGIRAWNELVRTKALKGAQLIKTDDRASFEKAAKQSGTEKEVSYNLISGATYGSSFVGMVHVLKESSTQSSQNMYAAAASMQAQMKVGGWFSDMEGGFGVSSSFASSAKKLLSSQKITSHVSLVTMGIIPSIVADEVQLSVKQFSDFSPDKMMGQLAALQNSTNSDQASVTDAAGNARTGAQMMAIRNSEVKSVMLAVGEIDDGKNKMLDVNSLMTAFTDYVNKAGGGDVGVPIEYFLKPITANQLFQMWVAKYFPAKYVTSSGDDTAPEEPATNNEEGDVD